MYVIWFVFMIKGILLENIYDLLNIFYIYSFKWLRKLNVLINYIIMNLFKMF